MWRVCGPFAAVGRRDELVAVFSLASFVALTAPPRLREVIEQGADEDVLAGRFRWVLYESEASRPASLRFLHEDSA